MTPNLLPLYIASAAMICLLSFFARHNKRTGWSKPEKTSVPNLTGIHMNWEATSQLAKKIDVAPPATPTEVAAFSSQLSRLNQALGQTAPIEIHTDAPIEEHARV